MVKGTEQEALERLNTLRCVIESQIVEYKSDEITITISAGLTHIESTLHADFSALLTVADKALYDAKAQGRNKIVSVSESEFIESYKKKVQSSR